MRRRPGARLGARRREGFQHPATPAAAATERRATPAPAGELRAAARRAAATSREPGDPDPWPLLADIATTVEGRDGRLPRADEAGFDRAFARRLLDRFRAEVVRGWAEGGAPSHADHVVGVLEAMERVAAGLEPPLEERVAARLGEPGGRQLLREVAHDLQSPLTSILFLSETLRRGQSGEVTPLQQRQLGIIYSASLSLVSMVNGLLELLGGETSLRADPTPFSIADLLDQVGDLARPVAEEKGIALHLHRPHGPPRTGYPQELSRVLVNLATNALKFTESGFVEISAVAVGEDSVEFSVRDTGRGLSPTGLASLYEPFRPAAPGRHFTFSGSGLGLSICRRLVQGMGSLLQCETVPDWGTRFHFRVSLPPAARESV